MTENVVNIAQESAAPKKYTASLYCSEDSLPDEFVSQIRKLEVDLDCQLWMLIQQGDKGEWCEINEKVYCGFLGAKTQIVEGKRVGLLLHSFGGDAEAAYKIVRLFQRRATNGFFTIVPYHAKSATTLMAVGGDPIVMGREAELGPLDVQIWDGENNEYKSALNAVQSLERLNAYAMSALDQVMVLLIGRTGKKMDALWPMASQYATNMIKPLMEKMEPIALAERSRDLKVAEDYAVRLMKAAGYEYRVAKRIAGQLVERYSTHGFVIDKTEAEQNEKIGSEVFGLGLKIAPDKPSTEAIFDELYPHLDKLTVIGRLTEAS